MITVFADSGASRMLRDQPEDFSSLRLAGDSLAEPRLRSISGVAPERVRAAGSATQGSELFRLLVESVQDYAIFVLDPEGYVITWNEGAKAIKGYTTEEIIGQHFSKFYPLEAVESGWPARELALAEQEGRFADEGWRVRKDGTVFWASVIITALRDANGRLAGFAKVTRDMTERRQWEERIQELNQQLRRRVAQLDESHRLIQLRTFELQKLSGQLLRTQDEERRRLARELHDDLGQQLISLKMAVDGDHGKEETSGLVGTAIATVRNLSYLLHPPLLDEVGLLAALHWYIDGIVKRSKIRISLTTKPQTLSRLPQDIETTIFRVIQESLTNVYRHSESESARVEIEKQSECVIVRVRDYGKGLPPDLSSKLPSNRLGVGVNGMRERLSQFGGQLTISPAEPGTLVEAKIPLFAV